ncbi:MAG: pitrilysin family protein [Planctomycetota bacterium]
MAIEVRDLACGATLLVQPMAGVRSCALNWVLPAGVSAEPEDRLGIAGIVAELVQRGAGGRDSRAQADALDRAGVERSVDAGVRTSRLSATFVGADLEHAVPLLADALLRPALDAADFAPAQSLAIQDVEGLADDPQMRASIEVAARHLPEAFGRSTLGTLEGLRAATHGDAVAFHRARYVPGGSIIALAGDVDADRAERALDAATEGWAGDAEPPPPGQDGPRGASHIEDGGAQVQVYLMRDAPADGTSAAACERLAAGVLSGGMSGRLFTEVREKRGLCYAVSAGYTPETPEGWLTAYVGTTPERAAESLEVLQAELDRIATDAGAPTPEEFARARIGLKSRLVFGGESTGARAAALANDYRKLGRCRTLEERVAEIERVTLDELRAHLAGFDRGRQTVLTLGPTPVAAGA